MKIFIRVLIRLLAVLLLVGCLAPAFEPSAAFAYDEPIIIDHTTDDISQIPQYWIRKAKTDLHIGYGHQSHGWQLTLGMTGLVDFANNGGLGLNMPDDIYAYSRYGNEGGAALDLEETTYYYYDGSAPTQGDGWLRGDCGTIPGEYQNYEDWWANETIAFLNANPDVNVIMWAWCWEMALRYTNSVNGTNQLHIFYLDYMNQLEQAYPNVKFVYMTSRMYHGSDANVKGGNQQVHQYCLDNNKILYDFGDIESWNPDNVYFEFTHEDCSYYSSAADPDPDGNWGTEWQASHTEGVDWYDEGIDAAHTKPVSKNLKAYAAWWLWARLAGWDGTPNRAPVADNQNVSTPQDTARPIVLTASDADGDGPYLTYTYTDPPHGELSGTAPNLTYTPDPGYTGDDSFTFKTNDGHLDSNEATVSITINSAETISITIIDSTPAGIHFGSLVPGDTGKPDTDSNDTTPSIIVSVDAGTTVPVDLQIKGTDFGTGFAVTNAKYSTTYAGTKTELTTIYAMFASNLAPGNSANLWHWLDIPPSGVSVGDYSSTFSYKAIAH